MDNQSVSSVVTNMVILKQYRGDHTFLLSRASSSSPLTTPLRSTSQLFKPWLGKATVVTRFLCCCRIR